MRSDPTLDMYDRPPELLNERERAFKSKAAVFGHPIHPFLGAFPLALLVAALITDAIYASNKTGMWSQFSYYLIWAGTIMAGVASLVGLIDFVLIPQARANNRGWTHFWSSVLVCTFGALNIVIRWNRDGLSGDRLTGGVILSAATTLCLLLVAWSGTEMSYRDKIGVIPEEDVIRT